MSLLKPGTSPCTRCQKASTRYAVHAITGVVLLACLRYDIPTAHRLTCPACFLQVEKQKVFQKHALPNGFTA